MASEGQQINILQVQQSDKTDFEKNTQTRPRAQHDATPNSPITKEPTRPSTQQAHNTTKKEANKRTTQFPRHQGQKKWENGLAKLSQNVYAASAEAWQNYSQPRAAVNDDCLLCHDVHQNALTSAKILHRNVAAMWQ